MKKVTKAELSQRLDDLTSLFRTVVEIQGETLKVIGENAIDATAEFKRLELLIVGKEKPTLARQPRQPKLLCKYGHPRTQKVWSSRIGKYRLACPVCRKANQERFKNKKALQEQANQAVFSSKLQNLTNKYKAVKN